MLRVFIIQMEIIKMIINLGIIGEKHTIQIFNEVIPDYKELRPHIFFDEKEDNFANIINNNDIIDVWLVFDQIFYTKIQSSITNLKKPLYCIPYRGASFFKVLCSLLYKNYKIEEISMDTIPYFDVARGLKEMGINVKTINCLNDNGTLKIKDYYDFHYNLYKSGKTKTAITRSYYIKKLLEESGIPAINVTPLRVTIRAVLNMILSNARIKYLSAAQTAIQVFRFDLYSSQNNSYFVDDIYSKELIITQKLIAYSKRILGSFKPTVDGNFYIFTTRGMLENCTNNFTSVPNFEELTELENNLIASGIGIGNSAREAEANALIAIKHAYTNQRGSWFAVLDDKTITGPLGKSKQLNFQYNSQLLSEASAKTSLSISTLSKVKNAVNKYGRNFISAQELALALQILPRSARRILTTLSKYGYAKEVGEETPETKGRPRKIYGINL